MSAVLCDQCLTHLGNGWRIDVPVPTFIYKGRQVTRPLTLNDRLHHQARARVVADLRQSTAWAAKGARVPRLEAARVQLEVTPPDRKKRDVDSLVATSKPAVDGLRDAGVIDDDSPDDVDHLMPRLLPAAGRWRLALHIVGTPAT